MGIVRLTMQFVVYGKGIAADVHVSDISVVTQVFSRIFDYGK